MPSIIEQYKANKVNFTASSTEPYTSNYGPYNAFNTEGNHFSTHEDPWTWQVSFPQKVTASSYQLGGDSIWIYYTTKWDVSYSNDNTSFVYAKTDSRSSPGTTYTFDINPPIECKHFRLTAKEVSSNAMRLNFYKFDLFGSAIIVLNGRRNTCNNRRIKATLIANALIMTMQSRITY